jgi:hypothetical protein
MAKFRHGFPVSTAVMVGFLSVEKKVDRQHLIKLATAMLLSEELGRDIGSLAQWVGADLELVHKFQPPEEIDAQTVWGWRLEGLRIIWDANKSNIGVIPSQTLQDRSEKGRKALGLHASAVAKAFESKIGKEQKLAEEVARRGLLT